MCEQAATVVTDVHSSSTHAAQPVTAVVTPSPSETASASVPVVATGTQDKLAAQAMDMQVVALSNGALLYSRCLTTSAGSNVCIAVFLHDGSNCV